MLTAVIGQALRFDVHPPNLGVGGFDGLFNGTDRVFDLFGGQVIGEIQGQRDLHVRGPKMQGVHFVDMVDLAGAAANARMLARVSG